MAGVQADAHFFGQFHPVQNGPQLLKPAAHLAALSGHGLQCDVTVLVFGKHFIQSLSDPVNSGFHPCAYVGSGMEDQDSGTHGDGTLDLQSEKFHRDLVGGGIDGVGQVDDIGSMDNKRFDAALPTYIPRRA